MANREIKLFKVLIKYTVIVLLILYSVIYTEALILLGLILLWDITRYGIKLYTIHQIKDITNINILRIGNIFSIESFKDSSIYRDTYEYSEQVIECEWEHSRVDGGPDRRYKDNSLIPVVTLGIVKLNSFKYKKVYTIKYNNTESANLFKNKLRFKGIDDTDKIRR